MGAPDVLEIANDFTYGMRPERLEWYARHVAHRERGGRTWLISSYQPKGADSRFTAFETGCRRSFEDVFLFPQTKTLPRLFDPFVPFCAGISRPSPSVRVRLNGWLASLPTPDEIVVDLAYGFELARVVFDHYARRGLRPRRILRAHNVERDFYAFSATYGSWLSKSKYVAFLDSIRLGRYEPAAWRAFDEISCVSPRDADVISSRLPGKKVTFLPYFLSEPEEDGDAPAPELPPADVPTLFFVNNFRNAYNVRETRRFLEIAWPKIRESLPAARFLVAGYESTRHLPEGLPGVSLFESAPSLAPFYTRADLVVILTSSRLGVKIKLIEALQRGKAIVSTVAGTWGSGLEAELPASDDMAEFARLCLAEIGRPRKETFARFRSLYDRRSNILRLHPDLPSSQEPP